jgi:hypothetical protein
MRRNKELILTFEPFFEGYIYLVVQITYNRETIRGFFRWASVNVNKGDININYTEL